MCKFFLSLSIFAVCIGFEPVRSISSPEQPPTARIEPAVFTSAAYRSLDTEHFSVFYGPDEATVGQIAYLLELSYEHFLNINGQYGFELHPGGEKLRWVIFGDSETFSRYAFATEGQDLSWLTGYYSARANMVAIVRPQRLSNWQVTAAVQRPELIECPAGAECELAKIVHEAGHQMSFNTGLQKRRVLYPIWASEGIAMSFERSLLSDYFSAGDYTDLRSRRLRQLYCEGKLIPLDEFVAISRCDDAACAADVYAQAWGFFQFLCDYRTESLRQYFASLYELEPGWRDERTVRREFIDCFGPPRKLEREWERFIEGLPEASEGAGQLAALAE